ncbi:lipocalin family protein [Aequorivita capsosiphonis]|uniref:lipocalin family protein n=1 Tax=Aequorivita capsosiphonis TaxID=487317 RepID=UPI00047D7C31|nr:lipocalin family protein [Aequorivita capsosiphonis]
MKTIQLKSKTLLDLLLMSTLFFSSTPSVAQSLEGKWNIAQVDTRHSKVIEFTKDSAIFYEFDKRQAAYPYHVEGNRLVVDTASLGAFEFVNPHRLRIKPDQETESIDLVQLKPTKTNLTRAEIEQLNFEITKDNTFPVNLDGVEDESGKTIQLEKIDSTYFLSFYHKDRRMGAMPIEQVTSEKIVVYGFPEKPFMITGERVLSNEITAKSSSALAPDGEMSTVEALTGKWFYKSIEGRPPLSDCTKKTYFQFTEDLSFEIKAYAENHSNGNCIAGSSIIGTYEPVGNDQIKIIQNGKIETWKINSPTKTMLVVERNGSALTLIKE